MNELRALLAIDYSIVCYWGVTKYSDYLFVCLLLETSLVLLDVTWKRVYETTTMGGHRKLRTTDFLLTIASDGTEDGVLLAGQTVCSTVDVVLGASSVVLGLAGSVLFAAGLLPRGGPCEVTNRFDDGTLDGMVLASGLAVKR
jgi:hypothetical protein